MTYAHAAAPPTEIAAQQDRAKLGMWMFLGSEVMFFTGFLAAYVALRMAAAPGVIKPQALNWALAAFNTAVLITSSLTMALGVNSVQRGDIRSLRKFLLLTALLGATFLVVKGFEYGAKFSHGIYPSTDIFYGTYFVLTGFHGLHVLGGVIALSVTWVLAGRRRFSSQWYAPVENVGLYWHFVDVVWIFLFPVLYLLPA
jgi:heme/copper-type cytochrome/quinol oxidase subunit 3